MTYSQQNDEFYVMAFRDETFIPIRLGLKRTPSGMYCTNNYSIAARFRSYADDSAKLALKDWVPFKNELTEKLPVASLKTGTYAAHQQEGIEWLLQRKRALLADQQRVGKTVQSCGYINSLEQSLGYNKVLVIVPDNLRSQWLSELQRFCNLQSMITSARNRIKTDYKGICIVNYRNVKRFLPEILAWNPDVLVNDESHLLTNPDTQRTIAVKKIVGIAKRVLFLTGTPFSQTIKQSFHLFNMLSEHHFDTMMFHEDNLKQWFDTFCLRRTRKQVYGTEPTKHREFVLLDSTGLENQVQQELSTCYQESGYSKINFKEFSRARRELAIKKIPMLVPLITQQVIENKVQGRKTLIVAYHKEMITGITEVLRSQGIKAYAYYGSMTQTAKDEAFDICQNHDGEALVVSIRSACTGLTATAFEDVIYAEMDYSPINIEQMEDRVVLHTKHDLYYSYYLLEGSYDHHLINKITEKSVDQNKIFRQVTLV